MSSSLPADTIRVRVRLNANLRVFSPLRPPRELEVDLPGQSLVRDLVGALQLIPERLGPVVVNLRTASLDYPLQSGDEVVLFPPVMAGGTT